MPWMRFAPVLVATGLIVAASACQSQPAAESAATAAPQARGPVPTVLAKAKLADAVAAGKKWHEDAILIQIGARNIGDDGKHIMWDYGFWSASAKACALVNVAASGASNAEESGGEECGVPEVQGNFIDSDEAARIARSNGVNQPKGTMFLSVGSTPKGERLIWSVMDGGGTASGDVLLDIDAQSGEVLNTTRQR